MNKQLEYIAMFMALLVISLPFCISSVYADQANIIKKATVYDENDVEGAVNAKEGTIFVEVELESGEELLKEEIFYESDNNFLGTINNIFDYCTGGVCVFSHPIYSKNNGQFTANIKVDTIDTNEQDSISVIFCADDVPPTVLIKSVKQQKSSIEIAYSVEDNVGNNKQCAQGIKEAVLLIDGIPQGVNSYDGDSKSESGVFTKSISELSESEELVGSISIVVQGIDVLGNKGESNTKTKNFDSANPEILADTLAVTDELGNPLDHIAGSLEGDDYVTVINIMVDILEDDIKSAEADLSGITLEMDDNTVKAECTKDQTLEGTINHCVWSEVKFDGKAQGNIKIVAKDKVGNKVTVEKTLPITKIEGGPVIDSIFIVGQEGMSKSYVKDEFDVGIRLADPVGFNISKQIYLKGSGVTGLSDAESSLGKKPTKCIEPVPGTWECYFEKLKSTNDKEGVLIINPKTKNDLNQKVNIEGSAMTSLEFIIDKSPPTLVGFKPNTPDKITAEAVQKKSGTDYSEFHVYESLDCPTYEQSLDIIMLIADYNKPNIIADVSSISSKNIVKGQCSQVDQQDYPYAEYSVLTNGFLYECDISIGEIRPAEQKNNPIYINVTDPAGNMIIGGDEDQGLTYNVDLCTTDYALLPPDEIEYIKVEPYDSTSDSLKVMAISLRNSDYPLMVNIVYKFRSSNTKILSQSITCDGASSIVFPHGDNVVGKSGGDEEKFAIIKLKKKKTDEDDPNADWDPETGEAITDGYGLDCTAQLSIRQGETIYSQLEEEKFALDIDLVEPALGGSEASADAKFKALEYEIDNQQSEIDKWQDVVTTFDWICGIAEVLGIVATLLNTVKSTVQGILMLIQWTGNSDSAWNSICTVVNKIVSAINQFIWPTNSLPIPPQIGHIFMYVCAYFHCTFSDPEFWGSMAGDLVSAALTPLAGAMYENADKKVTEVPKTEEQVNKEMKQYEESNKGDLDKMDPEQKEKHLADLKSQVAKEKTLVVTDIADAGTKNDDWDENVFGESKKDIEGGTMIDSEIKPGVPKTIGGDKGYSTGAKQSFGDVYGQQMLNNFKGVYAPSIHNYYTTATGAYSLTDPIMGFVGLTLDEEEKSAWWFESLSHQDVYHGSGSWGDEKKAMDKQVNRYYDDYGEGITSNHLEEIDKGVSKYVEDLDIFNPYRVQSIGNLCPKALLFEAKKHKQLLCVKKLCYDAAAEIGSNMARCDNAYKVHECLYIKSAAETLLTADKIESLWWTAMGTSAGWSALYAAGSFVLITLPCYDYYKVSSSTSDCTKGVNAGGIRSAYCGLAMSGTAIYEFINVITDWEDVGAKYWENWLEGDAADVKNYCKLADVD